MATVIKIHIHDLDSRFFEELGKKIPNAAEVEIRIPDEKLNTEIFSDDDLWNVIELFDWSKKDPDEIMTPAVKALSNMPVMNIYLFADKLSEKLYQLDTREHGTAYLKNEGDDYLSVDDFLYVRCAVVAEGKTYFEQVLNHPDTLPVDITFEPLLSLADKAYTLKTGREFDYFPSVSYETYSNKNAWK